MECTPPGLELFHPDNNQGKPWLAAAPCRLVETNPATLLDLEGFKETVVYLKRRMPYPEVQKALRVASDPRFSSAAAQGRSPQQRSTAPKIAGRAGLPPAVADQSGT